MGECQRNGFFTSFRMTRGVGSPFAVQIYMLCLTSASGEEPVAVEQYAGEDAGGVFYPVEEGRRRDEAFDQASNYEEGCAAC